MRAGLPKNEPIWVQRWLDEDIYGKLRAKRQEEGAEKYILHLGPPYANGHMHMGHALTYVLKDIVVRSKFMAGYDSPYAPGWDCHGLPIEWKVEEGIRAEGKTKHDYSLKEIRDRCRAYAAEWIEVQKSEWQRFGALGDWDRPYKTMDYANEAGIVRELGKMITNGFVSKGLRSVMWSTVEETALAEAEIEYKDKESKCIYVKFPVVGKENEFVVIWTTTPWTMPSNRAIAYAAEENYVALKVEAAADGSLAKVGDVLWVAAKLQEDVIRTCGIAEFGTVGQQQGSAFEGWQTTHPFYDRPSPLLEGFHVTTESGTGFVHIAPAHGQEDFQIGKEQGLELHCPVLGNGAYDETVKDLPLTGVQLEGQIIWKVQDAIIEEMRQNGSLLHTYKYMHSYPVSWRSKAPLIFRATPQWFISLDQESDVLGGATIRQKALEAIHGGESSDSIRKVKWVPEYGENRIGGMVANRPDWCISRQRSWGVPITVFFNRKTDKIISDPAVFEHIASLVEQEGIDAWDSRIEAGNVAELFPAGWLDAHNVNVEDLEPQRDVMDVWIDSGTSHAHVLRADAHEGQRFHRTDGLRPANLYLEGSDQHRGWFHSSLLTSIACYGDAPYEEVVTNGFVVDGEGRKFSKSLGNGVEPRELLDAYGMDIIRLWVASSDYSEDIRYSDEIMKNTADAYRRFRNTFRFLLGNLHGFEESDAVAVEDMPEIEQYVMHRLATTLRATQQAYTEYKFHHAYRALYDFCNQDLSNFYFDVRKDALYCDAKKSARRLACQTVLFNILKGLTTHLAPIMPFTTDETWRTWFGAENSVHMETYVVPEGVAVVDWAGVFELRDDINKRIEEELRTKGEVGANVEVAVTIPQDKSAGLSEQTWAEALVVSSVTFGDDIAVSAAGGEKCPRCWTFHNELAEDGVCQRCSEALKQDGHEVKAA